MSTETTDGAVASGMTADALGELEQYALDAGFASVEVLPIEHDQFRVYRLHRLHR